MVIKMLSLTGKVVNVFSSRPVDKETGEIHEKMKIQIMGNISLPDGQSRVDLITVTAPKSSKLEGLEGCDVRLPVGIFAPSKGNLVYFLPKGEQPHVLSA